MFNVFFYSNNVSKVSEFLFQEVYYLQKNSFGILNHSNFINHIIQSQAIFLVADIGRR